MSNKLYTKLSHKYCLPKQVIEVVCNSPFKFAANRIGDIDDKTTIMFAYLFKLKIKNKFKDEESTEEISTCSEV